MPGNEREGRARFEQRGRALEALGHRGSAVMWAMHQTADSSANTDFDVGWRAVELAWETVVELAAWTAESPDRRVYSHPTSGPASRPGSASGHG